MMKPTAQVLLIATILLSGCVSHELDQFTGPGSIIIQNNSGVDLKRVTLSGVRADRGERVGFGSVSPILKGYSHQIRRTNRVSPLPKEGEVSWVNFRGQSFNKLVSLEKVLRTSTNSPEEALVFEINAHGNIRVYLKRSN
ncbi:hypothetical protein ACFL17_06610 [Pseudomonadota bacterium]